MGAYETPTIQPNEFSGPLAFPILPEEYAYDVSDFVSGSLLYAIESGTIVLGIANLITTAFSGSNAGCASGSCNLLVGTSSDDDAYLTADWTGSGSANSFAHSFGLTNWTSGSAVNVAKSQGQYFATAANLGVFLDETPAAGAGKLFIFKMRIGRNWRLTEAGV